MTVTTSGDTRVTEATEGSLADITGGDTVRIMGPEGDGGSGDEPPPTTN